MLLRSEFTEIGLALISLSVLFFYHLRLYRQVRNNPLSTEIGLTNHARRAWVQSIVDQKKDILAVQTIRNWMMASTFLASTAILISLGLVASAFRSEIASSVTQTLNVFGHPSETLWLIKLFVVSALFFYAFLNFALSIRYYNHASLVINVPQELEPASSVDSITLVLNHGALRYSLGMRGFHLAIPLALWLLGPIWMLCGSVLLVFLLNRLDRAI